MSAVIPSSPSVWRAPELSLRWWPVFLRNWLVWRKLAIPSLIGNIAEPLIWLVAFGYGMGALVGEVQVDGTAVPYILFLASGSICMSAMNAASFEALYSAFSRMHVQKTWDGIMNAPVGLDDVVLAEMLWAGFKAIFTVSAILLVMLALGISHSPKLLVAWAILLGAGLAFSAIALICLGVQDLTGEYPGYLNAGLLLLWLVVFTVMVLRFSKVTCPKCSHHFSQGKWVVRCPECGLGIGQED